MKKNAMLLGVLSLACTVNAQEADKSLDRSDRVRALQRQIMDLESLGRTKVLQERGVKPHTRPAVRTAYNVENFAPVLARFVRFRVMATVNGSEPCLDALELYGPDSAANLAEGARTTASSVHPKLGNFKEGTYGKGWCWTSSEVGKGWVQVALPAATRIARIVWSRDAGNQYHDRVPSVYRIEVSEDGCDWHTVATGEDRVAPGQDQGVSRSALLKALDPRQKQTRRELTDELGKLGAARLNEMKSGPQVGESVPGGFVAHFLNGDHAGKPCCPV
jgi:hypothetical protein